MTDLKSPEALQNNHQGDIVVTDPHLEAELEARFDRDRVGALINDYLENGIEGVNLREQLADRQFVVAYIDADSPYADIPRSVETEVFADAFKQSLGQVYEDYGKYDAKTTFATVMDVSLDVPRAAGVLRIIDFDPNLGFKDVNDLLVDEPENPWIEEIKNGYFEEGEAYDEATAWKRLGARVGADIKLDESLDIATHASAKEYRGKNGAMDGVSMLFFHACVRYSEAIGANNLLAIFDLPPLANLQQFGNPFELYEGLEPHPYGGPFPTIPAFCVLKEGLQRIKENDEDVWSVMTKGALLDTMALLPSEYLPEIYSDEAVNK